ncbi:MAG: TMEM175 family protein [Methanobacteriaceae archaeon]|nr:TMEM175 family protein [Methanobacteriaceae archaeon]
MITENYDPKGRLEALIDAIYAIAMTIIILEVSAPVLGTIHSTGDLNTFLIGVIPELMMYCVTFLLLGGFWYINHILYLIEKVDKTLIILNILLLMFIGMVPFSTTIIIEYGIYPTASIFFGINILLIELINFLIYFYAFRNKLLDESIYVHIQDNKPKKFKERYVNKPKIIYLALFIPTLMCIFISIFIDSRLGILLYVFIPFSILMLINPSNIEKHIKEHRKKRFLK